VVLLFVFFFSLEILIQLEALIEKNFFLHKAARAAYMAYVNAYAQHSLKDVFNVHSLDLMAVAKSFGFTVPPKVHLRTSS
jgi:ATP-dependent RNA helicase DDX18/HAS1